MVQQNNIFFTSDNLAFMLPLLIVCLSYACFTYVPVKATLPILGGVVLVLLLRNRLKAHKNHKLTNLDEKTVRELAGDDEAEVKKKAAAEEEAVKARKAKNKLEQRLAQEAKKATKQAKQSNSKKSKKKNSAADDDDDAELLEAFAKGSRATKSKKN